MKYFIIISIILAFICIGLLIRFNVHFSVNYLIKNFFNKGNVCVCGLRGTGKDTTFSLVTSKKSYISNTDYKHKKTKFTQLALTKLNVKNTYDNFIRNDINFYLYPYAEKQDIFIADAGVYFPSQYSSELDKKYGSFAVFQALSRHLGDCNIHFNVQNLNRVWNKLREQSDIYLKCLKCISLGKLVIIRYRSYEKYESAVNNVKPFRMRKPSPIGMNKALTKMQYAIYKDQYTNTNGIIKEFTLVTFRRGKYDTRLFKTMLSNGRKEVITNERKIK